MVAHERNAAAARVPRRVHGFQNGQACPRSRPFIPGPLDRARTGSKAAKSWRAPARFAACACRWGMFGGRAGRVRARRGRGGREVFASTANTRAPGRSGGVSRAMRADTVA